MLFFTRISFLLYALQLAFSLSRLHSVVTDPKEIYLEEQKTQQASDARKRQQQAVETKIEDKKIEQQKIDDQQYRNKIYENQRVQRQIDDARYQRKLEDQRRTH
jgi:hypothetical protein